MSKPDKPGELQDVEVQAISMVSKAANGEKFKIFKSVEDEPEEVKVPEVVKEEKDERGLFNALKNFFMGSAKVEKGEVIDRFNNDKRSRLMQLNEAYSAFKKILKLEDFDESPEMDVGKITEALDDFRALGAKILLGTETVEKAGRKISNSRLSRLKEMVTTLNEIISEVEGNDENVEIIRSENEVTKEEVQQAINEAVGKINVADIVKEKLSPVIERIEKIENARGFSNRVQEEKIVEKSDDDFWGNIF